MFELKVITDYKLMLTCLRKDFISEDAKSIIEQQFPKCEYSLLDMPYTVIFVESPNRKFDEAQLTYFKLKFC